MLVLLAGLAALALGLAACGGSDDTATESDETPAAEGDTDFTGEADPTPAGPTESETVTIETETTPTATTKIKVKGKNLSEGSSGKRVKQLQEALIVLGLLEEDSADGDFGAGTKRAVQAFQLEKGLKANGVANKKTIRQINAAVRKGDRFDDFESSTTSGDSGDADTDDASGDSN